MLANGLKFDVKCEFQVKSERIWYMSEWGRGQHLKKTDALNDRHEFICF